MFAKNARSTKTPDAEPRYTTLKPKTSFGTNTNINSSLVSFGRRADKNCRGRQPRTVDTKTVF